MAGGFTEAAFIKKLSELNNSSQSIQTLSLWLIHHRKHFATVVKIWLKELLKAKDNRKLLFMYLANDVIQNSRKKGPEYGKEFGQNLKRAFEEMANCDERTKSSLERILTIWQDRGIYEAVQIAEFKLPMVKQNDEPQTKKMKHNETIKKVKTLTKERKKSEVVDEKSDTQINMSPQPGDSNDPPESEELIKAILDLENNIASSDENVRERIAQLPREVSEVSQISKLEDKEAAQKLEVQVRDAVFLLNEYNVRLKEEMEHRKKVASMIREYLHAQEELLTQAEQNLEEYQEKLMKVYNVRRELQNHIQNLPDLTQLPNVVDGLAPLPSAENLFMP